MTDRTDRLGAVYGAKTAEEIADHYDGWADTYEEDMAQSGYRHPTVAAALLARYLPRGAGPVLDAGAGTGLLGECLAILGYAPLEALDISQGMLEIARRKGVYAELHRVALGDDLPLAEGHCAGVVCAGVLTTGHVGAEALPGLLRVTRPGGVLVLTVKDSLWSETFRAAVKAAGAEAELVETTDPYLSMPGEATATPSRAVVLRRR